MRCLVNWARTRAGAGGLRSAPRLNRSARMRAAEIQRCGQFSHTPCGDSFIRVFIASGYLGASGTVAENLAWGSSTLGSARVALTSWLASSSHRHNLLGRGWRDVGVAIVKANSLFGVANVEVWVVQFGRRG
ncbi:MAG: CAP domain-containing protein [Actinomycetota bacterium]|nr:CAP domain-containing protein [Actinomycetota bacterium]